MLCFQRNRGYAVFHFHSLPGGFLDVADAFMLHIACEFITLLNMYYWEAAVS
jgi:hypothetical protein